MPWFVWRSATGRCAVCADSDDSIAASLFCGHFNLLFVCVTDRGARVQWAEESVWAVVNAPGVLAEKFVSVTSSSVPTPNRFLNTAVWTQSRHGRCIFMLRLQHVYVVIAT
jgi:hypothetical protein